MLNTFNLALLPHRFLLYFSGSFVSPSFLPPPYPQPFVIIALSFISNLHLLSRCEALTTWNFPLTATRHPPPLVPAPRAVCLRLPPFPVLVRSPHFRPWPAPRYLSSPGGFYLLQVPPHLRIPASPSTISPLNIGIVQSLVSCQVVFRERSIGQVASTPGQSRALVLAPPDPLPPPLSSWYHTRW